MSHFIGRVGNRGIVLAMLGVICAILAFGILVDPARPIGLVYEKTPPWLRATLWGVPGLYALAAAAWRRLDPLAWGLLMIPFLERTLSFSFATFAGVVDRWWPGFAAYAVPQAWRGVVVYLAFVVLISRCAAGLDRPAPWDGRERRAWSPKV